MFKLLFSPKRAERHPLEMMLIAIFYSSISIILSLWIFPEQASIVMVFFTVLSCIYVVQGAFKMEEIRNKKKVEEQKLLKQHLKVLIFILFLFIGFVISFSFWTFVLPSEKTEVIFSMQNSAVESVRAAIIGASADAVSGHAISSSGFIPILYNNFKVLFISLVFAFFFGAGAIFILVWNASIMGYVIGNLAKNTFGIIGMPIAFVKYFVHGIPEMLAYLTVALAGGIIYIAVWRGDFLNPERNKRMIIDVGVLILISIFLLIVAALLEVYVSPFI
jgi:uncharacterized membrane protein SpoIIM required for sporulation